MAEAIQEGRKYGFAFTVLGRRRNIPMIASSNKGEQALGERLAINTHIQGSAADQSKEALNYYAKHTKYGHIVLSVHDEIVIECPIEHQDTEAAILEHAMNNSFQDVLEYKIISTEARGFNFAET